jgi:hypothetical protein
VVISGTISHIARSEGIQETAGDWLVDPAGLPFQEPAKGEIDEE